jgi:hypothetical protein
LSLACDVRRMTPFAFWRFVAKRHFVLFRLIRTNVASSTRCLNSANNTLLDLISLALVSEAPPGIRRQLLHRICQCMLQLLLKLISCPREGRPSPYQNWLVTTASWAHVTPERGLGTIFSHWCVSGSLFHSVVLELSGNRAWPCTT